VSIEQLDLRLVRYFVAVAEELHFGRAAARLHIAQPSLSHQIRRLEQQLGATLLTRTSRRVELTNAGQVLLQEGRRLLSHASRVLESTRSASSERLAVGFFGSAGATLLPSVLRTFKAQHPLAEVALHELLLDQLQEVSEGRVDVAFTRLRPSQVDDGSIALDVLGEDPRMLVVPRGHRLSERPSVRMADLERESFVVNPSSPSSTPVRWLAEQHRHGLTGRVAAEAASVQELLTLVAAGQGVSLVPAPVASRYPRDDVRYVTVTDAEHAAVSIARQAAGVRPIAQAFIETARRLGADLVASPQKAAAACPEGSSPGRAPHVALPVGPP
jgi:DNA-binding transcriptional LysR family regulator